MSDFPSFPIERDPGCPLDPPSSYRELLDRRVTRVLNLGTGEPAWAVSGYEEYKQVNSDISTFSSETNRPGYPGVSASIGRFSAGFMTKADEPRHGTLRRSVAAEFSVRRMESLRPGVAAVVDGLLQALVDAGSPNDLFGGFALKVPNYVICDILGVPEEDRDQMHMLVTEFMNFDPNQTDAARLQLEHDFTGFVEDLIEMKRKSPGDDLVSRLIRPDGSSELTDYDYRSVIAELISGGFDSTAGAIGLGIVLLLQHPDQLLALRKDPTLMKNAAEEIVRYGAISEAGRRRTAVSSTELGGCPIAAGDGVIALEILANRDAEVFTEPEVFDIHRPNARKQVGYGWGPHTCLGAPLARLELDVAIQGVLTAFPNLELAVPLPDVEFRKQSIFYGPKTLPVTW